MGVTQDLLALGEVGLVQGNGACRVALLIKAITGGFVRFGEWWIVVLRWSGGGQSDEVGRESVPLVLGGSALARRRGQVVKDRLFSAPASSQVPGRLAAVGVLRGAQNGLDHAVQAQCGAGVGDHAVRGQGSDGLGDVVRVGARRGEQAVGNVVRGQPGSGVQQFHGQRVSLLQSVEGDVPDAGEGAFGVAAVGGLGKLGAKGAAVGVAADTAVLGQVGTGLFDRQRKVSQLNGKNSRVGLLACGGGGVLENKSAQQSGGVVRVEVAQHQGGGVVGPACGAAAGGEVMALVECAGVGGEVVGVLHVVVDQ